MHIRSAKYKVYTFSYIIFQLLYHVSQSTIPSNPLYYNDQLVHHTNDNTNQRKWTQRYYQSDTYFKGPGNPILLILGGEGAIEPEEGLLYPFIVNEVAQEFNALVVQIEHRFYGESLPILSYTNEDLKLLMNTEQALFDAVRFVQYIKSKNNCSLDKFSPNYCAVIAVGGSYPGYMSAMIRIVHPDVVDIAYAASAPLKFYAQLVQQDAYYDHITYVAEKASSGCASAVSHSLYKVQELLFNESHSFEDMANDIGICPDSLPTYINTSKTFAEELFMIIGYTFANYNMAFYPPNSIKTTKLESACYLFQNKNLTLNQKLKSFLSEITTPKTQNCFDMSSQLPTGQNSTITGGDWSGVGTKNDGEMWDFQTCSYLIEQIGFSQQSMFPTRSWSFSWLIQHCQDRFNVSTPLPYYYVNQWNYIDVLQNISNILFTNGCNDGWYVGSITENVTDNDGVIVLNFPNGAHHSDLSRVGPNWDTDTDDIKNGYVIVLDILRGWLSEIGLSSQVMS